MKTNQVNEEVKPTGDELGLLKTEPGFTRGPLTASGNGVHKGTSCVAIAFDPEDGRRVTKVAEANARLFAAAPSLIEAMTTAVLPYEALLIDADSRKWIAPEVWDAIELAVAKVRAALALVDGPQNKETK